LSAAPRWSTRQTLQRGAHHAKQKELKKKGKANRDRKKKTSPYRSKEYLMFTILDEIFTNEYYIRNGYYSFLISPKGEPMQLDIFYPDRKLAFEYDGRQHSEYNPYFHKTKKQFRYLQECDILKDKICKEMGITLIRISHDKKITKDLIIEKLKKSGGI
jgi:hypothetical protein